MNRHQRRASAARQGTTSGAVRRKAKQLAEQQKKAAAMTPAEARAALAAWAAAPGRTQADIDAMNRIIEETTREEEIRKIFEPLANPDVKFEKAGNTEVAGDRAIYVQFVIEPEGRRFKLDERLRYRDGTIKTLDAAVRAVAEIANNVRNVMAPPPALPQ